MAITVEGTRPYRDVDISFLPNPTTGDVRMKKGADAVKRSVRNLVMTNFFERPFHPEIGSNVRGLLFENADRFTAIELQEAIKEVIRNFEPRAQVIQVLVGLYPDNNAVTVTISFNILNTTEPVTFQFLLKRTR